MYFLKITYTLTVLFFLIGNLNTNPNNKQETPKYPTNISFFRMLTLLVEQIELTIFSSSPKDIKRSRNMSTRDASRIKSFLIYFFFSEKKIRSPKRKKNCVTNQILAKSVI